MRESYRHDWIAALKNLFSAQFIALLAFLFAMTVFVGLLIWLAERRRNPEQLVAFTTDLAMVSGGRWSR